ncbi:MAG: C40 family peptidase [Armatimonadetes bacterium]|nr:C40 family peptidase [Armatimonadota bacterium]
MIISGTLWATALLAGTAYTPPNLHRVGANETFASISKRYSTGYERLMLANPDVKPERLRAGMVVVIPGRIKSKPAAVEAGPGAYIVKNGDTDWSVARRYGIKPSELRTMNPGVKWTALRPGFSIKVPDRQKPTLVAEVVKPTTMTLASTKPTGTSKHKVTSDDNDWIIARGYGITPKQLRAMNPGVDWNRLRPGSTVTVPGKSGSKIARITTKRARVIRDNVVVRSGARPDAGKVVLVEYGRFATVADRIGNYYKVKFSGGTVGWIRGDMLAPVTAEMVARAEEESGVRAVRRRSGEPVIARTAPKSSAKSYVARNSESRRSTPRFDRKPRRTVSSPDYNDVVASNSVDKDGLIGTAMKNMGVHYRWGGTSTNGFDCSGFTSYVYSRHGTRLPRTANEQSHKGQKVAKDELKKGDLVFFKTTRSDRVSHVGIYVGNGKFIHASSGGGKVRINDLSDGYYNKRFAGARRVANGASSSNDEKPSTRSTSSKKKTTEKSEDAVATKPEAAPKKDEGAPTEPKVTKGTDAVGR